VPGDAEGLAEVFWGRYDQPEPVAPTDGELYELWNSEGIEADFQDCRRFARAYAARYARPAIHPVPVSERLPGPKDLNGERWCWWFDGFNWMLDEPENWYTHWLPHHALPTPEANR
jgi:hypothetical protein